MITIIVLLILAGVTIETLMGNNGLINKAKDAKIKTEIASIKEEIQTDILGKQVENNGNISDDSLKEILEKYGTLSEEEKLTDKTLTTTKGNYEIKVSDIFNGTTVNDDTKNPTFTTVANAPDISGFNKSNTYYVSWDLKSSPYAIDDTTLISGTAPSNWYDYTQGVNHWANVKTTGGGNASATGNVYGVYDLAGGVWEYVSGILSNSKKNGKNTEKDNYYDFSDSNTYPNRYFNWYAGTSVDRDENYNENAEKYGDAVYETSSSGAWKSVDSWESAASQFLFLGEPVLNRGGGATTIFNSLFTLSANTGGANKNIGFRPVVLDSQP